MITTVGDPPPVPDLLRWLRLLADPATALRIEHAAHDVVPPTWRLAGVRVPGHINWLVIAHGVRGRVGSQAVRVESGSWLCLPPATTIQAEPLSPGSGVGFLRFRLHVERGGVELPIPAGGFLLPNAALLQPLFVRLIQTAGLSDPFASERQRGLVLALYGEAFRLLQHPGRWHARGLDEEHLRRMDAFVAQQLPRPIAPFELARLLRMRPDTFARAFNRTLGSSPRNWLASRRIQHAADLLLVPGATATAVAERCGYGDVFHFCRQFRRHLGCGTRAWRLRHGLG